MRRNKHGTLIWLDMVNLSAVYLDSGDRYEDKATRRDYTDIKIILNNALNGYALKGGPIKKNNI